MAPATIRWSKIKLQLRFKKNMLTFVYFDFPFWRAEVGRLALYLGGIKFENRFISEEEFLRVKRDGKLDDGTNIPFHQLPCLIVDGKTVAQTGGIARYCGKKSGIYPRDNLLAALTDQYIDIATEITFLVSWTGKEDPEEVRKGKRQQLAKGELARKLRMIEKNINHDSPWIIGHQLGLADIVIWRLMGWLTSGKVDGISIDIITSFPKIQSVCLSVEKDPQIKSWIASTYPEKYNRGKYL